MTLLLRGTLALAIVPGWMFYVTDASGQTPSFNIAPAFSAGTSPTSVAAGDFNGDGRPDLAVTNQNGLSVLLNDGNGGFQPRVNYTLVTGTNPQSVIAGDFNGDGKMDLAVANQGAGTVSIYIGNGSGGFADPISYTAGTNPRRVISVDLNGDGKQDLVVVNSGPPSGVSVLIGNGNGTFQTAKFFAAGSVSLSVAVGDFNGDGKPDLAVANEGSDNISVLLGNGDGTFKTAVNYNLDLPGLSVSPTAVVTGDFNGDGKLDLAVATPNHQDVAVLLGKGDGTFHTAVHYGLDDPNFVNGNNVLATADLNGDGHPDLVLANLSSDHVTVLLGPGDGTFPSSKSYAAGPEPIGVAIADFNGDGKPDIAAADNTVDGVVAVLFGNGDGTLQAAPLSRAGSIPGSFAVGDFNGDGIMDIVTASPLSSVAGGIGSGVLILGNGDGTFQAPKIWTTSGVSSVALGDVNGDGKLDLVETNATPGNGNVAVLLGKGDGTFQTAVTYSAGTTPQAVAITDLNGDGKLDLVVANHSSSNVSVLLGNGNGTFQTAVNYNTPNTGTADVLAIADFDGDGKPDVAVGISGINATIVAILLGNGNGTLQAEIPYAAGFASSATLSIVSTDFNADGKFDLAVTDGATLAVLLGNGNGSFQVPVTAPLVVPGNAINGKVVAGDFNGDGKPDLAVTTRDGAWVLPGNGDGAFQAAVALAPFIGGAVAVGDFNGDGRPDLVMADSTQDATPTDTVAIVSNTTVVPIAVTINSVPSGLQMGTEGLSDCTSPCDLTLNWGTVHLIGTYDYQLPDLAGARYHFDHWSDGGGRQHNITVPRTPITYTAYFNTEYLLSTAVSPPSAGQVLLANPGAFDLEGGQYAVAGTVAGVVAVPNSGYTFTSWSGNVANPSSASTTVTMTGPQTVTANFTALAVGSASPASGSGLSHTFTFTFTDVAGWQDLAVVNVLVNQALDGIGACYVAFAPSGATSGFLYLVDDAGDGGYASGSPMALPSSSKLQNSQCTITGKGSSVSGSGNTLTLTLAVTFASSFAGNQVLYTAARSNSGNSGWQAIGTWNVPGTAPTGPAVGAVTPARSSTAGQTYKFTFTDTNGHADLAVVNILINDSLDGIGACYMAFVPASATSGYLYLVDDAGDGGYASGSPISLPSSSTLQNSQCTINGTGSSVSASGNTLTLNLALTFSPTFLGNRVFYLAARNSTENSGWQAVGSVTVP